jgi:hypothetical protein
MGEQEPASIWAYACTFVHNNLFVPNISTFFPTRPALAHVRSNRRWGTHSMWAPTAHRESANALSDPDAVARCARSAQRTQLHVMRDLNGSQIH